MLAYMVVAALFAAVELDEELLEDLEPQEEILFYEDDSGEMSFNDELFFEEDDEEEEFEFSDEFQIEED